MRRWFARMDSLACRTLGVATVTAALAIAEARRDQVNSRPITAVPFPAAVQGALINTAEVYVRADGRVQFRTGRSDRVRYLRSPWLPFYLWPLQGRVAALSIRADPTVTASTLQGVIERARASGVGPVLVNALPHGHAEWISFALPRHWDEHTLRWIYTIRW